MTSFGGYCCKMMHDNSSECETHGDSCSDVLIVWDKNGAAIPVRDGGSSVVSIKHCPWCGNALSYRPMRFRKDDVAIPIERMEPHYGPFWRMYNDRTWNSVCGTKVDDTWIYNAVVRGDMIVIRGGKIIEVC